MMHRSLVLGLLALTLLLGTGCALRQPDDGARAADALAQTVARDTGPQQTVVRRYLDLIEADQYAAAWQMLTPERQQRQSVQLFEAAWRALGQVEYGTGVPFLWPGAVDQIGAEVFLLKANSVARTDLAMSLAPVGGAWRIAAERREFVVDDPLPTSLPAEFRRGVGRGYGPLWASTVRVIDREPFEDGQIIIYRYLDPLLGSTPHVTAPIAMLEYARPTAGGWQALGGGAIGTLAAVDRYAVSCAWTWLRFGGAALADQPDLAAFYCIVADPRVATVELVRQDGAAMGQDVAGQQAVVFPYAWDFQSKWPAQQPRAIHLFDARGQPLALTTSPVAPP